MGVGRQTRKRRAEAFRGRARAHASSRKEGGFRGIEAREEEGEGANGGETEILLIMRIHTFITQQTNYW